MDRHVKSSKEVLAWIAAQRRVTSISSVIIALLLMFLIGILLYLVNLSILEKEVPQQVTYIAPPSDEIDDDASQKKAQIQIARRPTPPGGGAPSKIISAITISPIAAPTMVEPTLDQSFGIDEGFGNDSEKGFGGGDFGTVPGGAGKRCNTDDRLARLATTGGSPQCETAVINALRYLKKNQHEEGFWGEEHRCGITGLALLAYLGHCETPISEEFGEVVFNATVYLIDRAMKNRGRIFDDRKGPWCYEHAIATYALCESYLFSRSFGYQVPNLKKVVQEAVQWIIDSQNTVGSWDYRYGGGRRYDTSITAWHLQALKAAKSIGLKLPKLEDTVSRGLQSLIDAQLPSGGIGYDPNRKDEGNLPLTGAGVLCLQQHHGRRDFDARQGIGHIAKNSRFNFKKNANFYEHYYVSQAAINEGGAFWKSYNKMFRDQMVANQNQDGSWPNPPGNKHSAGTVYNTALATLMLEVYYRYLPGTGK